jgi:selenocysteine lyase/cysteine desulfurase
MSKYLIECNANHGGAFATSIASDAVLEEAHQAMADFYNAASPEEIVFGNNMTTLTLHISRSISREWKEGEEIVVTRLDHDANVTPWVLGGLRCGRRHAAHGRPAKGARAQAAPAGCGLCCQRTGNDQSHCKDHSDGA